MVAVMHELDLNLSPSNPVWRIETSPNTCLIPASLLLMFLAAKKPLGSILQAALNSATTTYPEMKSPNLDRVLRATCWLVATVTLLQIVPPNTWSTEALSLVVPIAVSLLLVFVTASTLTRVLLRASPNSTSSCPRKQTGSGLYYLMASLLGYLAASMTLCSLWLIIARLSLVHHTVTPPYQAMETLAPSTSRGGLPGVSSELE